MMVTRLLNEDTREKIEVRGLPQQVFQGPFLMPTSLSPISMSADGALGAVSAREY